MADLLECLIQVKALRNAVTRLEELRARAADRSPAERAGVVAAASLMAAEEHRWATAIGAALPASGLSDATATWPPARGEEAVGAFCTARRTILAVLDGCSAGDFAALARVSGLGPVTVADIVAHMLAHDTEQLGTMKVYLANDRTPPTV